MSKALFLAYYFPPLGGAGVQRSVKFVRYLPENGYECVVATCSSAQGSPIDSTLGSEIPDEVPVYRVPESKAAPAIGPVRYLRRLAGVLSPEMQAWQIGAMDLGEIAILEHRPSVIFATASPFCSFPVAAELSRQSGIPWVADLRDPWALDEMIYYPTRWHRMRERRAMREQLSTAARIVMNTPEAAKALTEAFPDFTERISVITNGYDSSDFDAPPAEKSDGKFRIVHTGHLHTALGKKRVRRSLLREIVGGHLVPVDVLTRSHVHLLGALASWRRESPESVACVEVVLAGALRPADLHATNESGVSDLVDAVGYVGHADSVALLQSADLLFLPMHNVPSGYRSRIVPAKTYEYLASRRPILAAVPRGDARDFVEESNVGECCEPDDEEAILEILKRRVAEWKSGESPCQPNEESLRRFDRKNLTRELASVFREVEQMSSNERGTP